VTIGASASPGDVGPLERPHNAPAVAVLVQTPLGSVVAGTLNGDVIIVSAQALAFLRAGLFLRAFVLRGIVKLRQTVALAAGQSLVVEYGMYRVR